MPKVVVCTGKLGVQRNDLQVRIGSALEVLLLLKGDSIVKRLRR
jgi:hypothetical protein